MNEKMLNIISKGSKIAHRGCWNYSIPENSPTAFRRAVEIGLPIELDVHLLADGSVAVAHDSSIFRMCFKRGRLEDMRVSDLTNCRLWFSNEHIPTFKEVLEIVGGRVPLYIELKCRDNELELADALLHELDGYDGDYIFIGFYAKAGAYLKDKGYTVGYSCAKPPVSLPYEADCMICHILGVPEDEKERAKYPPFVPWTISNGLFEKKAHRVSDAAIYNTKEFKYFRKMLKK